MTIEMKHVGEIYMVQCHVREYNEFRWNYISVCINVVIVKPLIIIEP